MRLITSTTTDATTATNATGTTITSNTIAIIITIDDIVTIATAIIIAINWSSSGAISGTTIIWEVCQRRQTPALLHRSDNVSVNRLQDQCEVRGMDDRHEVRFERLT